MHAIHAFQTVVGILTILIASLAVVIGIVLVVLYEARLAVQLWRRLESSLRQPRTTPPESADRGQSAMADEVDQSRHQNITPSSSNASSRRTHA
jgi:hypothetical protein